MRVRVAAGLLLLLGSAAMAAAPPPGRPDLSGFWQLARASPPPDPALLKRIPPGTALLDDSGAKEYGAMDFGGLKLKPEALAAARGWNMKDDMTISNTCRIPSIVYAMQGPFPIEIFQGTEFVIIRMEYFDMVRVIFMDGRSHLPADGPHTKTGDSLGHWEGDTLVVDTTHLKEATITNNGLEHSRNIRVTERFKLSADGKQLLATQEYDDPTVLENRGARFIAWNKVPGDHVHAYDCDPSFAENYAK